MRRHGPAGFTLVELLLSIGIIGILSGIVIVAINPLKQLSAAEDVRRINSAQQLQKALAQYVVEYDAFPGDRVIPEGAVNALPICRASFAESIGCINFDALVESRSFLPCFPRDGSAVSINHSGFAVYQETGRAFVTALHLGERPGGSSCETLPIPIAHWRFDEGEGTIASDSATSPHTGTLTNMVGTAWTQNAAPGFQFPNPYALDFDGVNDYVSIGNVQALQLKSSLTITWWQYIRTFPSGGTSEVIVASCLAGESEDVNCMYAHGIKDVGGVPKFRAFHENGAGINTEVTSVATVSANIWQHVAIIRDEIAKTYQFVIDGSPEPAQSFATNPTGGGSANVTLGSSVINAEYIDGRIDDVRIYPLALTGGQIFALTRGNP